ncbi:MAG: succinyldiaminopimelate transaminase [Cellvibrionaceae bacterium]
MNSDLQLLQAYPFEKLNALKAAATIPPADLKHIPFSIGEPKHQTPQFVLDVLSDNLDKIASYPSTKGLIELRESIANWLCNRFSINNSLIDPEKNVLPVNGTREALFAFAQAVIDRNKSHSQQKPIVISPNPFYQIYEGAAYLSGAEIFFMDCTQNNHYLPDFSSVPVSIWEKCQLIYLCSPGNPSGAVVSNEQLKELIALADKYDFVIASDECYSEIYFDEATPPIGLLEVCADIGRDDFSRCVVFHSLSKRSNLPGLRSGFVAGDADILSSFLFYRTYHGCAMSVPIQIASSHAWNDEKHVVENRKLYKEKFSLALDILKPVTSLKQPDASFYLWLPTTICDKEFSQKLFSQENVTVLPGTFIARNPTNDNSTNPGENHVRIALVANKEECIEGVKRIRRFIESLN